MNAGAGPMVDPEHPWLGLDSFSEESRAYFHGREEEVAELGRRVQRKLLTILFGQSGLGKTSILRAGIVPKLRPEGYCPVYVRIDYAAESPPPSAQIKQAIFRATEAQGTWTRAGTAVEGESLWEFLHHRDDILRDASGRTVIPLLIFDQFEEIFTLAQADEAGRQRAAQFVEDLADLVENRPPKALEARLETDDTVTERFDFARADYRILIALREDYLAHLEGLKRAMPSITQNRMRLARMTGSQALAAVMKPGGKLVTQEVAEAIVRFVGGGLELRNAEVEPSLLSLVCRELNNTRIAQGRSEISADLLAGSRETILHEFYERALADQPAAVRHFIEDEMLTDSGYRESLGEERVRKAFATAGAAPEALATLVNRRLLRIEERLDLRRVELTHDVLCGVVQESREVRHEREAKDEAERQLAAQKAREEATRKSLVRARQVATGCAALAIVAVGSAVWGYSSMKRAQEAEAQSERTRLMAETARGESEKLIVYLLDDFYRELEPVGRGDIVGDLAKRALDYYAALPPELRTAGTERNRALAQVRYGFVLRYQAKLDDAEKVLDPAVATLAKLRDAGDASEITTIGYALGLTARARVFDSKGAMIQSVPLALQAQQALAPLVAAGSPSAALRRAQAQVANYLGFLQVRTGRPEDAIATLELARATYRGIDDLKFGDLSAAAGYAESTGWQMDAYENLGRVEESRKAGEEAFAVATGVLERRPGHMGALRARALLGTGLARNLSLELRPSKGLAFSQSASRDWESLIKHDPGNSISWGNLGVSRAWQAWPLHQLGRMTQAIEILRGTVELDRRAGAGGGAHLPQQIAFQSGWRAVWEAELGNRAQAQSALLDFHRYIDRYYASLAPTAFPRRLWPSWGARFEAMVADANGEPAAMRDRARAVIANLEKYEPTNEGQKNAVGNMLAAGHVLHAEAHYALKDYAAAEKAVRQAIERRKAQPEATLQRQLEDADDQALLAMILARQERLADARQAVEPALALHRKVRARGSEDVTQHLSFARALLAASMALPAQAPGLLPEAMRVLDAMPPEAARLKSAMKVRGWIAEEQRKAR